MLAGGLVVAACGGDDAGDGDAGAAVGDVVEAPADDGAEASPDEAVAVNQLPDVVVDDLIAGTEVNVRDLAPSDRPILLWMYAPH